MLCGEHFIWFLDCSDEEDKQVDELGVISITTEERDEEGLNDVSLMIVLKI